MEFDYHLIAVDRLKNQANQIINDWEEPDNFIDLNKLTKIEQGTLIDEKVEKYKA